MTVCSADCHDAALQIVLVTDEACVPELEPSRFAVIAFNDAVFIPGWFKQQVRLHLYHSARAATPEEAGFDGQFHECPCHTPLDMQMCGTSAPAAQLLKLGCAHLIETPFYLITDADTFYLNPFSAGELLLELAFRWLKKELMPRPLQAMSTG